MGRLYIGNLPWVTAEDELREVFAQCGQLEYLQIPTGRQGRSRGYGIVEYVNDQDAMNAVQALNGHNIGDRAITVREDKVGPTTTDQRPAANGGNKGGDGQAAAGGGKRGNRANRPVMGGPPAMDGCRCYIGNLSWQTTNEELMAHCIQAGTVSAAQVAYQKSGRSKGWGLVDFATAESAEAAIQSLHNSELGGRAVICRLERPAEEGRAENEGGNGGNNGGNKAKAPKANRQPQPERTGTSSGTQVVVRNLPWETSSMDLREVYQQVGTVLATEVVAHADTGRSKGWGTVTFQTTVEAEAAVQGFNGIALMGREMQVKIDRFA